MTMTRGPDITSGRLYAAANMRRFEPTALIASDSPIHGDTIHVEPEQDHQHHSSHNWSSGHQSDSNKVQDGVRTSSPTKLSLDFTAGESWCEMSHDLRTKNIGDYLSSLMKSPSLDDEQKLAILISFPPSVLGAVYERHIATNGPPRIPASPASSPFFYGPSEETYLPLTKDAMALPNPLAPPPIYPTYVGHFTTSEQARRYRKRARLPPKAHAPDVERVRRYGRQYWVRRIYEAMIDISYVSDSESSIHRQRFMVSAAFEPKDLEATAHHIFDSALAVHERGWSRPSVYYKKVVRGKLIDVSEKSLESRLTKICYCLRQKKATVDDAIRGGVTLALLCDNPEARAFTKASNNMGNKKRGERLRQAKGRHEEDGQGGQEERYQSE